MCAFCFCRYYFDYLFGLMGAWVVWYFAFELVGLIGIWVLIMLFWICVFFVGFLRCLLVYCVACDFRCIYFNLLLLWLLLDLVGLG